MLALLSLNELLRRRTETNCNFYQGVYLGYRIQGMISFDLWSGTIQPDPPRRRGTWVDGLTPDRFSNY